MRFRVEVSLQCYDPSALFEAAIAAAERVDISREMYLRARDASTDGGQFDVKALLTLASLLPGCDVTVERIGRGELRDVTREHFSSFAEASGRPVEGNA